jgi:hypothetical protein
MSKKEIELLKSRIEKLDAKDFDLEAWKNYTIVLLERIFGPANQKIKQIEGIEYDYSSWSLRDTSGYSSYQDACKKLSREILEASISELENFGLPELNKDKQKEDETLKVIISVLEDELKISQYKELLETVSSNKSNDEKAKEIELILKSYGAELSNTILARILANTKLRSV